MRHASSPHDRTDCVPSALTRIAALSHRALVPPSIVLVIAALIAIGSPATIAQPSNSNQASDTPADPGWPRQFEKDGATVIIHQPQVDEWTDFSRISLRAVTQVFPTADAPGHYGVISLTAKTKVDKENRLVLLTEPNSQVKFSEATPEEAASLEALIRALLPNRSSLEVSLDRVLAYVEDLPPDPRHREVQVSLDPPPIFFSEEPAALLIFIGEPKFKPIEGTSLMYALNTNWDVILDPEASIYYVRHEKAWLSSTNLLEGPFVQAPKLRGEFDKIPSDENWTDVRAAIPPTPAQSVPRLFVSTAPAELIVTTGEPEYAAIPGVPLMYVANTESPILFDASARSHYLLVAGRWFRSQDLRGPWAAATSDLPESFAQIPEQSPIGFVRASVPGTDEAKEAVLLASVPDKAEINRAQTTIQVEYDGEPEFRPIDTTKVQFAINTSYDVFLVDGRYYCCHEGAWFESNAPDGAWAVCVDVPDAIYTIPASHPSHNVTYVYVYDSTPDTVVVGSTSGYHGEYVVGGLLLFGAGMLLGAAIADDDDWYHWHWHYHSCFYSYGCGAVYRGGYGGYYRAARYYGPYGGAGAGAVYNPRTGGWARGAYAYGPSGAGFARAGYNPWTDTWAGQAGRSTPYGSWTRGAVVRDDEWVRGGTASNWRGSAGWVETSRGGGAIHADPVRGGQGTIVRDSDGNLYVGRDGNIYRRDEQGSWNQRQNGEWNNVDRPDRPDRPDPRNERPTTRDRSRSESLHSDLERQHRSRDRGNARSNNYQRSRPAGGGRGGRGGGGRRR
ncbi:MAG: hypothetical protein ACTS3F_04740 [Phycisphaerales bacterium]